MSDDSTDDSEQQPEEQPADSDQSLEQVDEQPAESEQPAEQSEGQQSDESDQHTEQSDEPAEQAGEQAEQGDGSSEQSTEQAPPASAETHTSIRDGFLAFSRPLEGRVPWMYLDIKGLVTTGVGNLIDPVGLALKLPFVHKGDGSPASEVEIRAEWQRLKDDQSLAQKRYTACEAITDLRLTDASIDELVLAKFDSNDRALRQAFSNWNDWPADAQLGAHSIAWAGAGFPTKWKNFRAAAEAHDWKTAAAEAHIDETGNPGIKARNEANAQLFHNAWVVEEDELDRTVLHYPQVL
jgi:GH24 family phage-related lysozyme (muramidase)